MANVNNSRLDRLFVLLSTASTASTRSLAARQLGLLVQKHPSELDVLLIQIHPLLHHSHWDTRLAAVEALEEILKGFNKGNGIKQEEEVTQIKSEPKAEVLYEKISDTRTETNKDDSEVKKSFDTFDLADILNGCEQLSASRGQEYVIEDGESDNVNDAEKQREVLNKTLGLDVAAKLGVDTEGIISNEDLAPSKTFTNRKSSNKSNNLSNREKNKLKRTLSKQKQQQISAKKRKLCPQLYSGSRSPKSSPWPLEDFCTFLKRDLFETRWEVRHGAATALREIIRLQGSGIPVADKSVWLEDLAVRLVTLIARDKFGDFVSDQVVAPVRESASQALGSVAGLMDTERIEKIIDVFLQMIENKSNWQCRHGAMLGIKYILAVRFDLAPSLLERIFPSIIAGLNDEADDVVGVAASALLPVVHVLIDRTESFDLGQLTDRLWSSVSIVDDLTSSTHSIMQLLAEILHQQSISHSRNLLSTANLGQRVPSLFPFLSHPSSLVRKAALSTLDTLTAKVELANSFLPTIIKDLLSNLFQRALLEHQESNLILIERIWNNACDFTPLGPLLMSACPLYGTWVSLITLPPQAPLPSNLLLSSPNDEQNEQQQQIQFLGGPHTQHLVNTKEKDRAVTRARYLGAKLLGKLAGFIVQPVPGLDYSKDAMSPMEMFSSKILLPNLMIPSAFRRSTIALIISEWCEQHDVKNVPESLTSALNRFLIEVLSYDETITAFKALQIETGDLIATLKHYKLVLPPEFCNEDGNQGSHGLSFEQIKKFLTETDFKAVVSTNPKLKIKVIKSILERVEDNLVPSFNYMMNEQTKLATMTLACVSGAVIGLRCLPEKLNPVIKPLMESIKREQNDMLQALSARRLAKVLEICVEKDMQAPVEKVLKNLVSFASADPNETPTFVESSSASINSNILTLLVREIQSLRSNARSSGKKGKKAKNSSYSSKSQSESLSMMGSHEVNSENEEKLQIQTRGAKLGLEMIIKHFHAQVFERLPKVHDLTLGAILLVATEEEKHPTELILCLRAFEIIIPVLASSLYGRLSLSLPGLVALLRSEHSSLRFMASRCLAKVSQVLPMAVMTTVIDLVIPQFESSNVKQRQGAIECLACIVEQVEPDILVPFIALFIVPVLGRMSDPDGDTRILATNTFATLIRLAPLDESHATSDDFKLPQELSERKMQERKFLDQLLNVRNLEQFSLSVSVKAELRCYQKEGVSWLAFLNKFKLHGILCDDMGLGKTLQTICIVAQSHYERRQEHSISLIICPSTLCGHWLTEVIRFVGGEDSPLSPVVYSGSTAVRVELRKKLLKHNLIISSYDVIRNDIEWFVGKHWNYVVLDEGQVIKNSKAKTTLAIKRLQSTHRLILSGTPIQNSVLELWSLFDFLMPGFLGTEKQFSVKFSRPIIASRDPKCSSKDQEAGALAMESLHRQVLPFVLRRMKEDVLKDLPPKITQDFYCDLSPIQVRLYEDYARRQQQEHQSPQMSKEAKAQGSNGTSNKAHIFQALQYLRKVCNHPKLILNESHREYESVMTMLQQSSSTLDDISHSAKLPALRDLLLQCGIGSTEKNSSSGDINPNSEIVVQHRALIFFQLKAMMNIVEKDLFKQRMPSVTYLRLDGSIPASERQSIVDKFNKDISIDVLMLSTSVGGLGLNLTGADTVIFVEHDWNPMKDLQAMDRAHRIGQKKVVNVYRLITRNTIEEKIMGLQQFKIKTANTVISSDNASLQSMATDRLFDLFSLDDDNEQTSKAHSKTNGDESSLEVGKVGRKSIKALLEEMPELWDESQYEQEYDLNAYMGKNAVRSAFTTSLNGQPTQ